MIDQNKTELAEIEAAATSFLDYGVGQVAYVRPISQESAVGYGIYAANGAQIATTTDSASALGFLVQHDLMPVVLH